MAANVVASGVFDTGEQPTVRMRVTRDQGNDRVPLVRADLQSVTYTVYGADGQESTAGTFDIPATVFDTLQTGSAWPGERWNFAAKFAAADLPDPGVPYRARVEFLLTGGEVVKEWVLMTTASGPGA